MTLLSQKIHNAVPVIGTDDIERSLSYYTQVLGFTFDFKYGDPPVYAGVKSGDVEIYFCMDPALARGIRKQQLVPEIFIWVSDADSLFREHTANGAEIVDRLSDKPWGARQYVVRDINGYHLKFAEPQ